MGSSSRLFVLVFFFFFFSSRRRHTRWTGDWSSDVCSSDLTGWIGDECLAGGHVQAEPLSLLALPVGSHAWLHPEPCHLVGLKQRPRPERIDRKSTRLNSSHPSISYAVFCLKKKKHHLHTHI